MARSAVRRAADHARSVWASTAHASTTLIAAHSSSARRSTESSAATSLARCARACAPCRWPVATAVTRCWAARRVSPAPKATTPSAMPTGTSLTASPVSRISRRAAVTCSAASPTRPELASCSASSAWHVAMPVRPPTERNRSRPSANVASAVSRSPRRASTRRGTGGPDRRRRRTVQPGPTRALGARVGRARPTACGWRPPGTPARRPAGDGCRWPSGAGRRGARRTW